MIKLIRSRLQYKLMLGFSLVLLVSLTMTTLYTQLRVRDILISRARDEQGRIASSRAVVAERMIADISTDLLFLMQSSTLNRYAESKREEGNLSQISTLFLEFLTRSGQRYSQICLIDPSGHNRSCAHMVEGHPTLVSDEPSVVVAIPRSTAAPLEQYQNHPTAHISVINRLSLQGTAGVPIVTLRYSAGLRNESGHDVGIVVLDAVAQPIFDLLVDPTDSTHSIVVDHNGSYVFGRSTSTLFRDRPSTARQIVSRPGGTILNASDISDTFTAFHELVFPDQDVPPWTVIYDQPISVILSPINQTLQVNIALTFILLLASLQVTSMLTNSIVRPMRALADSAERVGAGDLHAPIAVDSSDEIGALAHTFDQTVAYLRSTLDSAEARRREAETLYVTATALSSTLDLNHLLDRILDELRAVVPYDSSTVQIVHDDHVEIIGAYGLVQPERMIGACFPIVGTGPNAEVARLRTTLILDDVPMVYPRFNEEPYRADPIRSWLGVPLIFSDRLIGMIAIDKYEPGFYNADHARLASAFAAQAAIALENTRLYEAVRNELVERQRSEQAQLHAEEQLRQAQKMEAVGRLAGGVSHDFNNILTVILGECDLLLYGPHVSVETRQGLEQIRNAGIRAAALTRQLLAFSRRQVLQLATVNLNEIITPIERMLHRLIGEDVTLRTRFAPDLAFVRADASQIEQVIFNLCINSRDAMPNGGVICITTANVRIEPDDDRDIVSGDYVLLTVSDTGTGIDEKAREHIFEPFFTTKPHGKGTGLGLATVHGIIEQSGGILRFSSITGRGTSFSIYLPAMSDLGAPTPTPLTTLIPRPSATDVVVALVEDDDRLRQLVSEILSAQGFTVIEAADGVEALHICVAHTDRIDLLMSDVVMPGGVNGIQLATMIRATRPQIRVLLMSGYTDNALLSSSDSIPDMIFIQKPFTPAYLLEKIYEALALVV
jgi:signal transduction histidine kinase/HAMP domain-containing protein